MDDQPFHIEIPIFEGSAGKPEPTRDSGSGGAALPPTPATTPEPGLTGAEIRDLRTLLSLLGPGWSQRVASPGSSPEAAPPPGNRGTPTENLPDFPPVSGPTPAPLEARSLPKAGGPAGGPTAGTGTKAALMQLWSRFPARPPEQEAGDTLRRILEEIPEEPHFARIFTATAGVFPLQHALRHHTPDQSLAVFTAVTDRFLLSLAGVEFEQRRKLLRAVAKFASDLAGFHTFVCPEGDPFSNATCERVEGANGGNRLVREVHGFVIVRKSSGEVFRLGRVLT